jgi:hypothetical protein
MWSPQEHGAAFCTYEIGDREFFSESLTMHGFRIPR